VWFNLQHARTQRYFIIYLGGRRIFEFNDFITKKELVDFLTTLLSTSSGTFSFFLHLVSPFSRYGRTLISISKHLLSLSPSPLYLTPNQSPCRILTIYKPKTPNHYPISEGGLMLSKTFTQQHATPTHKKDLKNIKRRSRWAAVKVLAERENEIVKNDSQSRDEKDDSKK